MGSPPGQPVPPRPAPPSASGPPPLKLQPLTRPGSAPPPPPPPPGPPQQSTAAAAAAQRIEFQRLELKGDKAKGPGVTIPPRPTPAPPQAAPPPPAQAPKTADLPEDVSGVVPRGWPPPRVSLKADEETSASDSGSRFLPGPPDAASRGLNRPARSAEPARVALGPLVETELVGLRGPMDTDAQATWSADSPGSASPPSPPRPNARNRVAPPSKKGPALLIAAFTAVLGVVVMWPPAKRSTQASNTTSVTTESSESPGPLAAALPDVKPTPKPVKPVAKPSATPRPSVAVATPRQQTAPAVEPRPMATPKPVVAAPLASATPAPEASATATPRPVAAAPVKPSPTPKFTPQPAVEEPPARSEETYYSVRVFVTPTDIESKVYLVNSATRYMDQGRGTVRLQPDKKGTYMLKVISAGYETFSKEIKVNGEHKLAVRLEKIPPPPPPPVYEAAPAAPAPYDPGPAPAPAPYYPPPPPPAPSGGPYQIQAPGI